MLNKLLLATALALGLMAGGCSKCDIPQWPWSCKDMRPAER
jgi:hypothetical protein